MNKNIAYVSILKPISDPRADKILGSLNKHYPNHSYYLIASDDSSKTKKKDFFEIGIKQNTSRFKKIKKSIFFCKQLKVDIIIFNNIDFFWSAILFFPKATFIYDTRENFAKNIRHQNHYSTLSKKILPTVIIILEYLATRLIQNQFLAEKCYGNELKSRLSKHVVTLENKAKSLTYTPTYTRNNFFITGTLSIEYGTLNAIKWFIAFNKYHKNSKLKIIGKTSSSNLKKRIEALTADVHAIELNISVYAIPHGVILKTILDGDIGILPYQNNPCFDNKMPTKLYEYFAAGKVIISQKNHCYNILSRYGNMHILDFTKTNKAQLGQDYHNISKLKTEPSSNKFDWITEENKLIKFAKKLLS